MTLLQLSWKNITFKPLNTGLSIILLALGIGLISLLLLLQKQLQDNFERNLAGVDLVIGAKGSPLQLILSSMYHIDAPTGNVTLGEVRPFLRPGHPLIEQAVPLSMGDSYRGYRIVGAVPDMLAWYGGAIGQGKIWEDNFEATVGAGAARELGLAIGDQFKSSHGLMDEEDMDFDHDESFEVVGILEPTGTVLDQLILTTPQSFWLVHDHEEDDAEDHEEEAHDHDHEEGEQDHDHAEHEHDHAEEEEKSLLAADDDREITALLVRFKSRTNFQALNMQRAINENTDLQAATPAIEINRLFSLLSVGEQVLRALAVVIIIVSGLSIFISLFSSLRERRYELALMRVMGASRSRLFFLIVLEGLLLAAIGGALGLLLSHGSMQLVAGFMEEAYRYRFSPWQFLPAEGWLLAGALLLGFIAAALPAVQASGTDISETLARG